VTNNLQLQDLYSVRGLSPATAYELKVTAHNHAGSTTSLYQFTTLDLHGATSPALARGSGGLGGLLAGLGFRASLSILVSVLCLVLASIGVCFCIRKSKITKPSPLDLRRILLRTVAVNNVRSFLGQRLGL
jgi:hypothetical protein